MWLWNFIPESLSDCFRSFFRGTASQPLIYTYLMFLRLGFLIYSRQYKCYLSHCDLQRARARSCVYICQVLVHLKKHVGIIRTKPGRDTLLYTEEAQSGSAMWWRKECRDRERRIFCLPFGNSRRRRALFTMSPCIRYNWNSSHSWAFVTTFTTRGRASVAPKNNCQAFITDCDTYFLVAIITCQRCTSIIYVSKGV